MEKLKWITIKPTIWTKVRNFHFFVLTLKLGFNWEWSKQANIFFALQKHNCIIMNHEAISSTPKISFGFASILDLKS
jgi:hypothetical protein